MEHSIEFYRSVIRVIDHIADGNRNVSCEKGDELAGNYWPAIVLLFKESHAVSVMSGGSIIVTQGHYLNPLYEDSRQAIKKIEKAEADRELANREKIENITYGRKAYELAEKTSKWTKGSIIFTSLVALGQLIQWIILIIQWLQDS